MWYLDLADLFEGALFQIQTPSLLLSIGFPLYQVLQIPMAANYASNCFYQFGKWFK